jgi:uncharacterized protein YutE (UPF0331/DUF86 family)
MVDKPKLDALLTRLKTHVESLRDLARTPRDRFLADRDKVGNAKYQFIVAIECCIDIANHVIASERLRIPRDNADSFAVLVEKGLCPGDLEASLMAMARFRNRLVHLYWDVDDAMVFSYLEERLGDFDRFAAAIGSAGSR